MRRLCLASLSALCLSLPAAAQTNEDLAAALDALGAAPCEMGSLTCVTLALPRDPAANDPDATIDITFAISPATEPARATLIYVVGGPGASGLAAADSYIGGLDETLVAETNIVFFDQRGIGPVHGLDCAVAQGVFDAADLPLSDPARSIAAAQTYVTDCFAELADPNLLPYVSTDIAVRDLEAFRQAIGAPKVWVYGESYGSQFVQTYATAYPESVSGVIVDGVVDLNLSMQGYYAAYTAASERILLRMLEACDSIAACAADMQGSATAAYDALAARLRAGPLPVKFPLPSGQTADRALTSAILENNAFYALYGPDDRADFLWALAAAQRGDLVPMLRLGYSNLAVDPVTEVGVADPSWFGAAYYAVTCSDYNEAEGTGAEVAAAVMADATAYAAGNPRLLRAYFAERLVCALWPQRGAVARPAPFAGGDYPTLVLNSDTDPITPVTMAYSVFDNARNASLVVMQGGPHVIFGWGLACPDQIVGPLVLSLQQPDAPVQLCRQDFIGPYEPLTLTDPALAADPLAVASATATELWRFPELASANGVDPVAVGCPHGGTLTSTPSDTGTDYAFAACALWPGLVLDGTGADESLGEVTDGLTLTLAVSGTHAGNLTYRTTYATEAVSLGGSYDGKPVTTPRPLP